MSHASVEQAVGRVGMQLETIMKHGGKPTDQQSVRLPDDMDRLNASCATGDLSAVKELLFLREAFLGESCRPKAG
jgi:hypothetical protein